MYVGRGHLPCPNGCTFSAGFQSSDHAVGWFRCCGSQPTLNKFRDWVAAGQICYLVEQPEQLKVPGNSQELTAIQNWVAATFHSDVTDGTTVYDLGNPLESSR
ncbi:conserved hypothetical protein [Arthrobacter sp. Hiyo8]|nr:conserved hypothetical protein [Arthrobacter sp. Hiyo8]